MNANETTAKGLLAGFLAILSAVVLVGCASTSDEARLAAQTPQVRLHFDAAAYLFGLQKQDKLPGIRKGKHGNLTSGAEPLREGEVAYPVSVMLHVTVNGDDSFYRYKLVKQDSAASWQLVEAIRRDKSGEVVEQLFPK